MNRLGDTIISGFLASPAATELLMKRRRGIGDSEAGLP
ncbi:hypothetical protein Agau_L101136 [Agrobacterium tumefaciens F2]|nr:hypothetical protein Agau_L101136 [Agrobacterium tumefaciens F2]